MNKKIVAFYYSVFLLLMFLLRVVVDFWHSCWYYKCTIQLLLYDKLGCRTGKGKIKKE